MHEASNMAQNQTGERRIRSSIRHGLRLLYTRYYAFTRRVAVGSGTVIHRGARLERTGGGSIRIGRRCEIHAGSLISTYGGSVTLHDHVSVNSFTVLYGHGGLEIGEGTRIAAHCVLIPANHGTSAEQPIRLQPMSQKGITIGRDVWIGAGARILDGCEIADGCVLAAGAVLLPDPPTESMAIYGGVPAKKIGVREPANGDE